jgi:hypothetical protein
MKKKIVLLIAMIVAVNTIAQRKPDLVVSKIDKPEWRDNDSSSICITVKNKGAATSEPVMLKVWDVDISVEEAIALGVGKDKLWIFEENVERAGGNGNDYDADFVIMKEIPALSKGQSLKVEVFVDHWVYDSNCEIGAFIDCLNTLDEKNEDNNKTYFFEGG